ncbi:methionine permease [Fusarium oxysporum]|nr:methionine permease [Fusarium oxysporum]
MARETYQDSNSSKGDRDLASLDVADAGPNGNTSGTTASLHFIESNVLQDRTIGTFGAISLVVNKIVGAGIFSTPSTILKLSGSVGMALVAWLIGAIISTCGTLVILEFGLAVPRSGGLKNYLERSWNPKLLMTCIYAFYCVYLQVSGGNVITFSSYVLVAAGVEKTTWTLRGVAIAGAVFAIGLHIVAPRIGRLLQDLFSAVKLFTLLFIVCCGFAALAGHLKIEKPDKFSNAFQGTSRSGYSIGTAILNVMYSFQGYDNVNAVLSEVRSPQRTLRIALPVAIGSITILYTLANVAYFAAVPKNAIIASEVTVAATLFTNVFGESAGTRVLPVLVAISALGHLLGIAYTIPRVIQELGKDGIIVFPTFFMENRPFKTPISALLLHLGDTILFICAPPAGDAFNFVGLASYPTAALFAAISLGLIRLRISKHSEWQSPFTSPWIVTGTFLTGNIFLLILPLIPPSAGKASTSLPYWLSPVVSLVILSLGAIYYAIRFAVLPRLFNYKLEILEQDLSDGSKVIRFRTNKLS